MHRLRVLLAFLLAPVLPCILLSGALSAANDQWGGFVFGLVAMLFVSEGLILVLAIPTYFALRRFWKVGRLECVVAGMLVGLAPAAIGLLLPSGSGYSAADSGGPTIIDGKKTPHGIKTEIKAGLLQSTFGGTIGFLFWAFAFSPMLGVHGKKPNKVSRKSGDV